MLPTRKILCVLIAFGLLSCGKKASTSSGTTTSGSTKAVIKNGTTTVAHVVDFVAPGVASLYIPSTSRYAAVNLSTGTYSQFNGMGSALTFAYSNDGCPIPEYVYQVFPAELGKMVVADGSSYYLVTSESSGVINYKSLKILDQCTEPDGTFTSGESPNSKLYNIIPTTRPYNFEAIAPLTVTYE